MVPCTNVAFSLEWKSIPIKENVAFSLEWKSIPIKEKPHREFLDINVRKVKECKTLLEAILWPLRRFQRCPRSLLERGGKPLL